MEQAFRTSSGLRPLVHEQIQEAEDQMLRSEEKDYTKDGPGVK